MITHQPIISASKPKLTRCEAGKLGAIKSASVFYVQRLKRIETYNANPKLCATCNQKIAYEVRHNKFCSRSCSATFNNQGVRRHGDPDSKMRQCLKCGSDTPNKKFCSLSCASRFNNVGCSRNGIKRVAKPCLGCKKLTFSKKYCNQQSQQDFKWEEKKREIEIARVVPVGKSGNPVIAKRYLREVQGCVCLICKNTEWQGQPIPLVMDHIDGHSENWKLDNLRLICGNCDMLLPTYKNKNRGHGRAFRRERYAAGKSW